MVDAIGSAACEENAACGRRLMAIAELYARRAPEEDVERINWAIDGHANVVAEISAAPNISPGRAAGQLRYAIDLRERLPKVAAVFAQWAPTWMKMSGPTLSERIDMWVATFDPHRGAGATPGARGPRWRDRPNQPRHGRDLGQAPAAQGRRADALGAIAAGQTRLACGCGDPECPAAAPLPPPAQVVIDVIPEQAAIEGTSENPGYLRGFAAVPAPMPPALAATAQLRPVPRPAAGLPARLSTLHRVGAIYPVP